MTSSNSHVTNNIESCDPPTLMALLERTRVSSLVSSWMSSGMDVSWLVPRSSSVSIVHLPKSKSARERVKKERGEGGGGGKERGDVRDRKKVCMYIHIYSIRKTDGQRYTDRQRVRECV